MVGLPQDNYIGNAARTVAEGQAWYEQLRDVVAQIKGVQPPEDLAISAGSVTPTRGIVRVDTEGQTAADDLDFIATTNLPDGWILRVYGKDAARAVTLRHNQTGTGKLILADAKNLTIASTKVWVDLQRNGTQWEEVARGYGDDFAAWRSFLGAAADANVLKQGKFEIPVTAAMLEPAITNGCGALTTAETATNKLLLKYREFDNAVVQTGWVSFPAPKSADETAGFLVRDLAWHHPSTSVNFGVAWGFAMLAAGNADALDAAVGAEAIVVDTGGAADTLYKAPPSAPITPAGGWAEGDTIWLRVRRVVTDAGDTLAVKARFHDLKLVASFNAANDD